MAVITPNTDVILLKVPLEINDNNQLTFANATAQYNYFNGLTKKTFEKFTYQRKDNTITLPALVDEIYGYNYCMYRNTNHSNKWFYAYVTNPEYVSDSATRITIKTDCWQTYMFDLTYKAVLVEREHVADDTIGKHTYPEDFELGEVKANGTTTNFGGGTIDNLNKRYYTIIEVSQVDNKGQDGTLSYSWVSSGLDRDDLTPAINEIERGTIPLIVGGTFAGSTSGKIRSASEITYLYDQCGLGDSIINIYELPQEMVPAFNEIVLTSTPNVGSVISLDGIGVPVATSSTMTIATTTFTRPSTIDGYTPKNNKMFTYPYCYFNISNNAGTCQPFRYEDFSSTITFKTEGTFGVSGSTKAIPQNYRGVADTANALDFSITGPKYPVCSWRSDSYTNWLTQNAVNMDREQKQAVVKGAIQGIGAGAAMLGAAAMTGGLVSIPALMGLTAGATVAPLIGTVKEQVKAKTQANMTPDQVGGNTGAGDFLWAKYRSPFTYMPMSIKQEYAKIIDSFFSAYGYEINEVKVPNINSRTNWNYIKTVGCYIQADIPQEDLEEIKSLFDKGITFWHNPATFMDYTQTNSIVV